MSYTIVLSKTNKKLRSTDINSTSIFTANNVTLKEGCSIVNPVFEFTSSTSLSDLRKANYVTWDSYYYWIDDIKWLYNDYYQVSCTRDPWGTFGAVIGNYTALIGRCNNDQLYNKYDNDNIFTATNKNRASHSIQIATTGFAYARNEGTPQEPYYSTQAVVSFYGADGLKNLYTDFPDNVLAALLQPSNLWDVAKYGITQPGNYIKSALLLPFESDVEQEGRITYIGNEDVTILGGFLDESNRIYKLENGKNISTILNSISEFNSQDPQVDTLDDYRRFNDNFVQVAVKLPFAGVIQIPADVLSYDYIGFKYLIDMITGCGEVILFCSSTGQTTERILHKCSIRVGASIPITSTTAALVPIIQSIASNNVLGMFDSMLNPTDNTCTGSTDSVGYWDIGSVDITINIRECDNIANYDTVKGHPTNKIKKINKVYPNSSSEQYIECLFPSIKITGATKSELEEINAGLSSGFYYFPRS